MQFLQFFGSIFCISLVFAIELALFAFVSREALKDDIEAYISKNAIRRKLKRSHNLLRRFFLSDFKHYIKKWRYAVFCMVFASRLMGVTLWAVSTAAATFPTKIGSSLIVVSHILEALFLFIPWNRYRNK